jgi:hypothetical protein
MEGRMSSRCWEPCDHFRGRWDTAHYRRNIAEAGVADLPALREAFARESALLSPRKGLIRSLRSRITILEKETTHAH